MDMIGCTLGYVDGEIAGYQWITFDIQGRYPDISKTYH
jgi:hypothetical protein